MEGRKEKNLFSELGGGIRNQASESLHLSNAAKRKKGRNTKSSNLNAFPTLKTAVYLQVKNIRCLHDAFKFMILLHSPEQPHKAHKKKIIITLILQMVKFKLKK